MLKQISFENSNPDINLVLSHQHKITKTVPDTIESLNPL